MIHKDLLPEREEKKIIFLYSGHEYEKESLTLLLRAPKTIHLTVLTNSEIKHLENYPHVECITVENPVSYFISEESRMASFDLVVIGAPRKLTEFRNFEVVEKSHQPILILYPPLERFYILTPGDIPLEEI